MCPDVQNRNTEPFICLFGHDVFAGSVRLCVGTSFSGIENGRIVAYSVCSVGLTVYALTKFVVLLRLAFAVSESAH